jgi:hypothetical protein
VKARSFIVGFLIVVAAIAVVSIYFGFAVEKTIRSVAAFPSPDGKYKAVKITLARGGTRPFCFDSVALVFAIYPDDFAERDKGYEVFSAPCGKFADGEVSPNIAWRSNTDLQIDYVDRPTAGQRKATMKTVDVTKIVHVSFSARP